jgi:beta-glucosidase
LKSRRKACACLKHYIGYSGSFNGRDRSVAYIPEILLREYYLPTFENAVKAGVPTVMINSGTVNGIPGHANSFYINDILKTELKFQGLVVSDWEDIIRLHTRDKVAETPEDAVRMAVMAGVDMSMVPLDYSFRDLSIGLAKKDAAFLERVNDATMRILKVKEKLGLFENSYPVKEDLDLIGTSESEEFNLEAARESIVMAKNANNILPLSKDKKILVTGPTGNCLRVLNGGWSYTFLGYDEKTFENFGRKKSTIFGAISGVAKNTKYLGIIDC